MDFKCFHHFLLLDFWSLSHRRFSEFPWLTWSIEYVVPGEVQAQVEAYDPVSEQLQAKIKICKILGPRSKNDFEMIQFLLRLKLVLIHIYDL